KTYGRIRVDHRLKLLSGLLITYHFWSCRWFFLFTFANLIVHYRKSDNFILSLYFWKSIKIKPALSGEFNFKRLLI
ncbi:MAG: hypothetical protein ACOX7U_08690, partial [Desulfitobacteriia bacterium]